MTKDNKRCIQCKELIQKYPCEFCGFSKLSTMYEAKDGTIHEGVNDYP